MEESHFNNEEKSLESRSTLI